MGGEIEAIGDVAVGGLAARVAEPVSAEALAEADASVCLNCGAGLRGRYCHQCGQPAEVHRSLGAIWHGFVHGVLHLDGKLWLTLPLLIRRPGELTRRYILGERAKFVSPLALFLFSVFLMFGVFSAVGGPLVEQRGAGERPRLEQARARIDQSSNAERSVNMEIISPGGKGLVDTGNPQLDAKVNHALEEPGLFFAKLQFNAYKFSWAIILISVPFVWLLFPFRRAHGVYDHAVFVTYSITAMSLLLVVVTLLGALGGWVASLSQALLVIVPPIHMFVQLKGAYGLSSREALWRTLVLLLMAFTVLGLFALLLLALGLLH